MEGNKQEYSSSSFTVDLFGAQEPPPSSSAGIFASMFPSPQMVVGRTFSSSEGWQKPPYGNQPKQGTPVMSSEGTSRSIPIKERSSNFHGESAEPCHLSSSLYYGGRDIYSESPSTKNSGSYPTLKKDGGEDDPNGNNSNSASRGNWWQGSLYY